MGTDTKHNYKEETFGERGDDDGYDNIASPKDLGLGCVSRQAEESIIRISGTTDNPPPHPPAMEINVNGAAFKSTKNRDAICVTEPITRRTIMCNEDLCGEG